MGGFSRSCCSPACCFDHRVLPHLLGCPRLHRPLPPAAEEGSSPTFSLFRAPVLLSSQPAQPDIALPHAVRPSPPCIYPLQEELGSPALAFVRTACHLLALDSRVADAVAVLRRQLLKLLHVREFGPQADFREVCLGFTLPDVICRCGWREGGGRARGGEGLHTAGRHLQAGFCLED